MEQDIPFNNLSPLKVKNLFRKLSIASGSYSKSKNYTGNISTQAEEELRQYSPTEKALMEEIKDLKQELQETREEKDRALDGNGKKIDELNLALSLIKSEIKQLIQYKKERNSRLRDLEKKIVNTVK